MGALAAARRALDFVLATLLLAMVVMVFGNVVLRYLFNSGIVVSEELSRFCFVWLTFIGGVAAFGEGAHLGIDNVVSKLPRWGQLACAAVGHALVLVIAAVLLWGTVRQHEINASMSAPVTGLPLIWIFGLGYLVGAGLAAHAGAGLWRIARGPKP